MRKQEERQFIFPRAADFLCQTRAGVLMWRWRKEG
jgi:hypothetical protein